MRSKRPEARFCLCLRHRLGEAVRQAHPLTGLPTPPAPLTLKAELRVLVRFSLSIQALWVFFTPVSQEESSDVVIISQTR